MECFILFQPALVISPPPAERDAKKGLSPAAGAGQSHAALSPLESHEAQASSNQRDPRRSECFSPSRFGVKAEGKHGPLKLEVI